MQFALLDPVKLLQAMREAQRAIAEFAANDEAPVTAPRETDLVEGFLRCVGHPSPSAQAVDRLARNAEHVDQLGHRQPASACLSTATICSTLNRLCFMAQPPLTRFVSPKNSRSVWRRFS